MKTIGLIGGMSPESTIPYYKIINDEIRNKLGGLHTAKILLYSVEFSEIEYCQQTGDWKRSAEILGNAAKSLQNAGADFILLCTNTMHKVADEIVKYISIPFYHIADMTISELRKNNIKRVGLLGTKYTLKEEFYKQKLENSGIEVIIPNDSDIELVNRVIFDELCVGKIDSYSKKEFLRIIDNLKCNGANGIILGCTEIGLLIGEGDTDIPIFDTTIIHAKSAADLALENS